MSKNKRQKKLSVRDMPAKADPQGGGKKKQQQQPVKYLEVKMEDVVISSLSLGEEPK